MLLTISSKKIEQRAINKIEELIEKIECADSNITKNDKNISWDGTIDFYKDSIDKKKNYLFAVDVQIKGRTINKKKLNDKYIFDLEISDLKNFLTKDGSLLLVCGFKKESDDYKIYYEVLLPYNINRYLKENKNKANGKARIKLHELRNSEHLEKICRQFKIDRDIQKRIDSSIFNEDNLSIEKGKIGKFTIWDRDIKNFNPRSLVGTSQYIYTMDENNVPIHVSYGELAYLVEEIFVKITDVNNKKVYDKVKVETMVEKQRIIFGKAFSIEPSSNTLNVNVKGTFKERLEQLKFTNLIIKDKAFLVNDKKIKVTPTDSDIAKFNNILERYEELYLLFNKHNINKDLEFDNWIDKDFEQLSVWLSAIEDHNPIEYKSDISRIGSIKIKDLRLSIIAHKKNNGMFEIESLWNGINYKKYYFMYNSSKEKINTNNLYLVLSSEAYMADDINIKEMKEIFNKYKFTNEETILLNYQVLEVLKAYDSTKKDELLDYAEYLANKLLEINSDECDIHYINYCQILKRKKILTDKEFGQLLLIRDTASSDEIKLCCNILMDNKKEANYIFKKLNPETVEVFKTYPISIYL